MSAESGCRDSDTAETESDYNPSQDAQGVQSLCILNNIIHNHMKMLCALHYFSALNQKYDVLNSCCLPLVQVPGYPAWYNVVYDGESSVDDSPVVYTYKLQEDWASGDLQLLVEEGERSQ